MSARDDLTAECMAACNLLKQHGLYRAASLLAKHELAERAPKRKSKRKAYLTDPLSGKRISGSAFEIDLQDAEIVERET